MPAQNLEKQLNYSVKLLNMEPGIPQNRSRQQLVNNSEENEDESQNRSLRFITKKEWITVIILCFVNLINYMDRFTLAGILTDIQEYYKIGDSEGGLLQTAFVLSYMIFAPLFGYLGDRYSRRKIMAFGVFLWSVTTLIGSFMNNFYSFMAFRALVGIGEASYSTIAPTIISDLFVKDLRSKMLALFYFAIPVGSGMGYIVGSETAKIAGSWQWGLRVTPVLGLTAVLLIIFVLQDPERGHSEGGEHLSTTSWLEDVKDIVKNPSFMLSTAGFTCVAFVAGALSWFGPKIIYLGIRLQAGSEDIKQSDVSYKFGILAMISGLIGVPAGSFLAQKLRRTFQSIDPLICAVGLIASSPMVFLALLTVQVNAAACYSLIFFAEIFINLTWSIVADMLLYVVVPTRRSTAEGFQLLVSHALGDAGSPYLIGTISDALQQVVTSNRSSLASANNVTFDSDSSLIDLLGVNDSKSSTEFKALQYALFTTCFVEILGAIFFLLTARYIVQDRMKVDKSIKEAAEIDRTLHVIANETERRTLMS